MTVRGRTLAIAQMAEWSRERIHVLPNSGNPPASVKGHCVGAVARAFIGRAAGFENATQWANRARSAGILLGGTPAFGDILLWTGGSQNNGHVGIAQDARRFWGVDRPTVNEIGLSSISGVWSSLRYAGRVRPEVMYRLGWPVIKADGVVGGGGSGAGVPVPPKPVVKLSELSGRDDSTSALLVNWALLAEKALRPEDLRAYWSDAAQQAFRLWRYQHGFGTTSERNREAFVALGARHGFTVA